MRCPRSRARHRRRRRRWTRGGGLRTPLGLQRRLVDETGHGRDLRQAGVLMRRRLCGFGHDRRRGAGSRLRHRRCDEHWRRGESRVRHEVRFRGRTASRFDRCAGTPRFSGAVRSPAAVCCTRCGSGGCGARRRGSAFDELLAFLFGQRLVGRPLRAAITRRHLFGLLKQQARFATIFGAQLSPLRHPRLCPSLIVGREGRKTIGDFEPLLPTHQIEPTPLVFERSQRETLRW